MIREVGEIIGALYKGPDSEGLIKRIKPLGSQSPEVFPVVFKINYGIPRVPMDLNEKPKQPEKIRL